MRRLLGSEVTQVRGHVLRERGDKEVDNEGDVNEYDNGAKEAMERKEGREEEIYNYDLNGIRMI